MLMQSGAELGLRTIRWCGPACFVTLGRSLALSGPQRRSSQRLLFIICTERSLLKREKSEAGGVAWRDGGRVPRGGLGPSAWRWEGLVAGWQGPHWEQRAGRQPGEVMGRQSKGLNRHAVGHLAVYLYTLRR